MISPDLLIKSSLTYLLFDDMTEWVRLGEKFPADPADSIPLGYYMDQWWMDHAEMMNDLFADLIAVRPFKWYSVVIKDDYAMIKVTLLEEQP